jgi:hypothetical protein
MDKLGDGMHRLPRGDARIMVHPAIGRRGRGLLLFLLLRHVTAMHPQLWFALVLGVCLHPGARTDVLLLLVIHAVA